jgi:hypothetical protein
MNKPNYVLGEAKAFPRFTKVVPLEDYAKLNNFADVVMSDNAAILKEVTKMQETNAMLIADIKELEEQLEQAKVDAAD